MNLTYFSPKTEKRPSIIHGRGLFSKEPISQGEIVVVNGGYVMNRAQSDGLETGLEDTEVQITDDFYIGPASVQELEGGKMHLNHSCAPNLGLQGQIIFVALQEIEKYEELTFDYAITDDDDYEMTCSCGSDRCRVVITGKDWMQRKLQQKYKDYFAWFIRRKILV